MPSRLSSIRDSVSIAILSLMFAGCAHQRLLPSLTPSQLSAAADVRDGQIVIVSGFLDIRGDRRHLFDSLDRAPFEARATDQWWRDCVSVAMTEKDLEAGRRFGNKRVDITGVVHKDIMRDGLNNGLCNRVGLEVSRISASRIR